MFPRVLVAVSRNGALVCAAAGKWGPFLGAPRNKGRWRPAFLHQVEGSIHRPFPWEALVPLTVHISSLTRRNSRPETPIKCWYCCSYSNTVRGSEARVPSFLAGLTLRWKFVHESANVQMMNFDSRDYDSISVEMSKGTEVLLDLVD
jgi:hypothetical protein